ncbi:ribonuclease T2 family protein [Rhizobium oryzicola]|uniref:Ribonuclease n=1 Tax=Rhizobium oryzicola TaxID=1232668 RepID=A0ABT8SW41_9HYPH|nr:ribonuclease [Rhizobium oryzicola]MDO1582556.1 ribonuclease [Rhizobium oryzicola]
MAVFRVLVASVILAGSACLSQAEAAPRNETRNLLAISWQPAFCEGKPDKTECKTQSADRFDASHFSLHGLWSMKADYCNVSNALEVKDNRGEWSELPPVELSAETRKALDKVMPGTMSHLDRHEWIKHGTCFGMDQETYFKTVIGMMEMINTSAVAELFASRIGKNVQEEEIRKAFVDAFGEDADRRVKMQCRRDGKRRIITEITIGLGEVKPFSANMKDLIRAAGTTSFGCSEGIVDPVGLQ